MSDRWPNPGSRAARALGCTCPVVDNNHGIRRLGVDPVWIVAGDCPLHEQGGPG